MFLQVQAHLSYNYAHKCARKQMKKNREYGGEMHPKEIDAILKENADVERIDLGVMDIPVNQIIGVADCEGKERYAAGFLPVCPATSGYAEHWRELYINYKQDKGFLSRLYCYEYLGKFYIVDGKKRVSILKSLDVPVTSAYVTRIVPAFSEEKHIQLYYEFIEYFKLTKLYQVSFSQHGSFEKLQKLMGHEPDQVWNDDERRMMLHDLRRIDAALESAFGGYMNVTPADALLVLLEEHSFQQIRRMALSVMADHLQRKWKILYGLCSMDTNETETETSQTAS